MANTENPFEHLSLNSLLLLGIETHTDLLAQQSVLEGAAKALAQRAVNADAMVVTNEPVPKAVEDIIAEPEPVDQIASVAVANSVSPSEPSPVQAASSRRRNNGGPSLKLVLSPTSSHDEKPTVDPEKL